MRVTRIVPALAALALVAAGCNFDVRHWPHQNNAAPQTWIYVENHTANYQHDTLRAVVNEISNKSDRVELQLVDQCPFPTRDKPPWTYFPGLDLENRPTDPDGSNCVIVDTADVGPSIGGETWISNAARRMESEEITWSVVHLAWRVDNPENVWSRFLICHELLHALGGGFEPESVHDLCSQETGHPRAHDIEELDRVHSR